MATHRKQPNHLLRALQKDKTQVYYDIIEQSKYFVTVKGIEDLTSVSDVFYTYEEMQEITGGGHFHHTHQTTVYFNKLIESELQEWAAKLDESGKKTLVITDHELVECLKVHQNSLAHYCGKKYMRRMDRIGYYHKRKKTKPTKGDVREMWGILEGAYHDKYSCWLPHIPSWNRTLTLFESLQDIVGYKRARARMHGDDVKFLRQVWYNPKEYF